MNHLVSPKVEFSVAGIALLLDRAFMIRPMTPGDALAVARVHVETFRHTYNVIINESFLSAMTYENSASRILRRMEKDGRGFVHADGNEIVAFADGGPERDSDEVYRGEVYSLYVLPAYQSRGYGRELVRQLVLSLYEDALSPVVVWVLEENTCARGFYESLSGRVVKRGSWTVGDQQLPEVGYELPRSLDLVILPAQ